MTDTDDPHAPTVVYAGFPPYGRNPMPLYCPVCERPADEFGHLADGRVFARHGNRAHEVQGVTRDVSENAETQGEVAGNAD